MGLPALPCRSDCKGFVANIRKCLLLSHGTAAQWKLSQQIWSPVALSRCRSGTNSGTNSGTFGALKCESDVRGLGQTTQLAGALVPLTSQARNQVCNVIACDSVL